MAEHLLKNNFVVAGFDVYAPLVDRLVEEGGKSAVSPAAAAAEAEVLLVMVTSSAQITSVLFEPTNGAVHTLPQHAVIIVSSTVPPQYCEEVRLRLDDDFNRQDVYLLDCPVQAVHLERPTGRSLSSRQARKQGWQLHSQFSRL